MTDGPRHTPVFFESEDTLPRENAASCERRVSAHQCSQYRRSSIPAQILGVHMLNVQATERAAEFWSDRSKREYDDAIDAKSDEAYREAFDAGLAQAEHDLVEFAKKFVPDPAESIDARCRRFLAEYIGYLDCSWGDLSAALASAAGLFQNDDGDES
ncbi:hypothetical protein [Burkholderia multivorans]|uniref:hypothetical protein n=1 Tax=Burkholderia multivorans TaxID=87883 RepID=UPI001C2493CD|nr:hypothetical protein [Burkholderia multivorans]